MYHIAVRTASNGFDVPLKTPSASAIEGSSAAPATHGNSAPAPCVAKMRNPAAEPNKTASANPASQLAKSCRGKILADENNNARVPNRVSRAPMPDQTRISHTHEVPSSCCRAAAIDAVACAISKPAATAYHHHCSPFIASFSSAISSLTNALLRSPVANVVSRVAVIRTGEDRAIDEALASAPLFSNTAPFANPWAPAACTAFCRDRPNNRAESNRSNTAAASNTSTIATPHHASRIKICDAVHGTPSQRNDCTTCTGLSAIVNANPPL